jgi:hypothetical protein
VNNATLPINQYKKNNTEQLTVIQQIKMALSFEQ